MWTLSVRRGAAGAVRSAHRRAGLHTRAAVSQVQDSSSSSSSSSSSAPVYSRTGAAPSPPSHTDATGRPVLSPAARLALSRDASAVARLAAEDPLMAGEGGKDHPMSNSVFDAPGGSAPQAYARARAAKQQQAELTDAQLIAEAGMADVMDPEFKFTRNPDRTQARALFLCALIAVPLLAYHLSSTVRRWTDELIAAWAAAYEAKYGKPAPRRDFLVPLLAEGTPSSSSSSSSSNPSERAAMEAAKKRQEETIRLQKEAAAAKRKNPPPPPAAGGSGSNGAGGAAGGSAGGASPSSPPPSTPSHKSDVAPAAAAAAAASAGALTITVTQGAPGEQPKVVVTPSTGAPATPAAATTAKPAAAPAVVTPPASLLTSAETAEMQSAVEILKLVQLRDEIRTLQHLERAAALAPRPVDADMKAVAEALAVSNLSLPASHALKELESLYVSAGLSLPVLPTLPRWGAHPASAAEVRERLEALRTFKGDYELAVQRQTSLLRGQLDTELSARLESLVDAASLEFEQQLPQRLQSAAHQTLSALEANEMTSAAQLARQVMDAKAAEWTRIMSEELERQRAHLAKETEKVVGAKGRAVRRELDPAVALRLESIQKQEKQVAHLKKELASSRAIEATGARVHALTSLLVGLEEALRLDEHKAPLFVAPQTSATLPSQVVSPPKTGADLAAEWARLLEVSKADKTLHALASSVPLSALQAPAASSEDDDEAPAPEPLSSLSVLRARFNSNVEPAARRATFLPEHVPDAPQSLPALLYARIMGSLSLREGRALRTVSPTAPQDEADAAHLSNAAYFLNEHRDLSAAVRELQALSERPYAHAARWIEQAQQRVHVEKVFGEVRHHVEQTAKTYAQKHTAPA